jgi:UDP-2,3-diacylglucosamine hydrolase
MTEPIKTLGLIAGNRSLPLELARQARAQGVERLVAAAFEGETDPALAPLVDHIEWMRVGQLSKLIATFTKHGVKQCVMAGQIAPRNLFDLRPDFRTLALLLRLKEKNARTLFGAVADELKKEGVELIEATPWLKPLMPDKDFRMGPALTPELEADAAFGFRIAKAVARLEIGQSVVVKRGTVLAVEGFEGTDRCLARGGELAGKEGGALAVKVARENHDMRFDIPCVGLQTVQTCAAAGIQALVFEAGRALLLDRTEVQKVARQKGISIAAWA